MTVIQSKGEGYVPVFMCCIWPYVLEIKTLDTEQVGSVYNTSDLYLPLISARTQIILILFMEFVSFSRQIPG
jgi:hypothetical protein